MTSLQCRHCLSLSVLLSFSTTSQILSQFGMAIPRRVLLLDLFLELLTKVSLLPLYQLSQIFLWLI